MSDIEDKILGRVKKKKNPVSENNYFSADTVWKVTRPECGVSVFNGIMVYEMLSPEGKVKARKGTKRIQDKGIEFVRCL